MSWGAAAAVVQERDVSVLFLLTGIHVTQGQLQTEAQADGPGRLQGTKGDGCKLWQLQD